MKLRNIDIVRGDNITLTFQIDISISDNVYFTGKKTTEVTDARIIDIKAVVTSGVATVELPSAITAGLNQGLYYDLVHINNDEETTLYAGTLNLIRDVRTPYDATPVDPEQYIPVKASDFTSGQFVKAIEINGDIQFQGYNSIRNGVFELDMDGNYIPKESYDVDDLYELDTNGDIMPKEII